MLVERPELPPLRFGLSISVVALFLMAGCASRTWLAAFAHDGQLVRDEDGLHGGQHLKDANLQITPGVQAMYMNQGKQAHTVSIHVSSDSVGTMKVNKTLQPGQTETYTFAAAGTYHVYCKIHGTMTSGMSSTVTVA